jgi:oligo-alginate lyase
MQTIAHNTVVVDERSQNDAREPAAEAMSGTRHFFEVQSPSVQAMSARADDYWPGVRVQRTVLLLRDRRLPHPVTVDLVRVVSDSVRQVDWPLHFRGQLIATNVRYTAATATRAALGQRYGYQHLWREAAGRTDSTVRMTWLDGGRYYSVLTAASPGTEAIFARSGAADSLFNLMVEPMLVLRRRGAMQLFASVIEPHGNFNEAQERSDRARPRMTAIEVLASDAAGSVVAISGEGGLRWTVHVTHESASSSASRRVQGGSNAYTFTGNVQVTGLLPISQ